MQRSQTPIIVELRKAKIPTIAGTIADHYWFVIECENNEKERWEVWQKANAGPVSWGYVHLNLKPYDAGVGNGPSRVEAKWRGEKAEKIADILRNPDLYPWRNRYLPWPGPNSNTYVNWVLLKSGVKYRLGFKAWGRSFAYLEKTN